jgi:hypothetical protein
LLHQYHAANSLLLSIFKYALLVATIGFLANDPLQKLYVNETGSCSPVFGYAPVTGSQDALRLSQKRKEPRISPVKHVAITVSSGHLIVFRSLAAPRAWQTCLSS